MTSPKRRPWTFAFVLALAFGAGAAFSASPLRAATGGEDAIVRQLECLTDTVKELAQRESKTVCECRCGS